MKKPVVWLLIVIGACAVAVGASHIYELFATRAATQQEQDQWQTFTNQKPPVMSNKVY